MSIQELKSRVGRRQMGKKVHSGDLPDVKQTGVLDPIALRKYVVAVPSAGNPTILARRVNPRTGIQTS